MKTVEVNEPVAQRMLRRTANDNAIHIAGANAATHLLKSLRENRFELHLSTGGESLCNCTCTSSRKYTEVDINGAERLEDFLKYIPPSIHFRSLTKLKLTDLQNTGMYNDV
jgi:hypothetical protein